MSSLDLGEMIWMRWALNPVPGVLIEKGRGDLRHTQGDGHVTTEAEMR